MLTDSAMTMCLVGRVSRYVNVSFEILVRDANSVNVSAIEISVDDDVDVVVVVVIVGAKDISAYSILSQSVFKSLEGYWGIQRCPTYALVASMSSHLMDSP